MEIKKTKKQPVEEVVNIICDICEKSCKIDDHLEYMRLQANWGYYSKNDLTKWTAQVCEKCVLEKLVPLIKFKEEETKFGTRLI